MPLARISSPRRALPLRSGSSALLLLALGAPAPAAAQGAPRPAPAQPPRPGADKTPELKRAGDEAMAMLRYEDALRSYTAAFEISRDPALLYNRGRASQALGLFPEALDLLEAFRDKATPELRARVPKLDELLAEVRARVSLLRVTSNVVGARVLVRQRQVGVTPLSVRLNAGRATVEVEADGRVPFRQDLELPGAGESQVEAELKPRDQRGVLAVKTTPDAVTVMLDGRELGVSPLEVSLEPGPAVLALRRAGYQDAGASAVIVTGERREVRVTLERQPGLTSRWWFWTAVGAVVIGGVVVTAALLTERGASRGDLEPGRISAPVIRF